MRAGICTLAGLAALGCGAPTPESLGRTEAGASRSARADAKPKDEPNADPPGIEAVRGPGSGRAAVAFDSKGVRSLGVGSITLRLAPANGEGSALAGTLGLGGIGASSLVAVRGRVVDSEIQLEAGGAELPVNLGRIEWTSLVLRDCSDRDADGAVDAASLHFEGGRRMPQRGPKPSPPIPLEADIPSLGDAEAVTASLRSERAMPGPSATIADALRVDFDVPVALDASAPQIALLADGNPIEARFETSIEGASPPVNGHVVALRIVPELMLPFGAKLELSLDGIRTLDGRRVIQQGVLELPEDPGPLTSNPSFEKQLAGWVAEGEAVAGQVFDNRHPPDGEYQAFVLAFRSTLWGYFDVPADARELSFFAVYTGAPLPEARGGSRILLRTPGNATLVLEPASAPKEGERVTFDLSPYRGKRVVLDIDGLAPDTGPVDDRILLLDDLRVR